MKKTILATVMAYYRPPAKFERKGVVSADERAPGPIRNIVNTSGGAGQNDSQAVNLGKSRGSIKSGTGKKEKEGKTPQIKENIIDMEPKKTGL